MRQQRARVAAVVILGFAFLIFVLFVISILGRTETSSLPRLTQSSESQTTLSVTPGTESTPAQPSSTPSAVSLEPPKRQINLLFVIVPSESMKAQVNGVSKLEIVKSALTSLIQSVPDSVQVGALSYVLTGQSQDCENIALRAPFGSSKQKVLDNLRGIQANGKAPIAEAVQNAEQEFQPGKENYIVLVADTMDGCGGSPSSAAKTLLQSDAAISTYVVAFAPDPGANDQLSQIALESGGKYYQPGNSQELDAMLSQVFKDIAAIPDPGRAYLNTARTLIDQKLYDDAVRKLALSTQVQSNFVEGYAWWGEALSHKAQTQSSGRASLFDQAKEKANQALEVDKLFPSPRGAAMALNVLGEIAFENRDYTGAIEDYKQALNLDSTSEAVSTYQSNLGLAQIARGLEYVQQGRPDLALADCTRPEAQNTKNVAVHLCVGLAHSYNGDNDQANQELDTVLASSPNNVVALTERGRIFRLKKDYASALTDLSLATQQQQTDATLTSLQRASVYKELGYLHLVQGQFTEGLADFMRARDMDPEDPENAESYVGIGWAELSINFDNADPNARKEAVGYLSHALDDFNLRQASTFRDLDTAALALRLRAKAFWRDRAWTNAINDCTLALRLDPNKQKEPSCYFYRGSALFEQQLFGDARSDLEQFISLVGNAQDWSEQVKLAKSEVDKIKARQP